MLEVRPHDVPFLVEDGQVFFRLRFFRTNGRPDRLYGEGRSGPSYRAQDLTWPGLSGACSDVDSPHQRGQVTSGLHAPR